MFLKFSITASFVACLAHGQSRDKLITVELLNGGAIAGTSNLKEGVDAFLGIQYGRVGERFSRSSLVSVDSAVVVNATEFGPNCHQGYSGMPEFLHQPRGEAEECLYLNIWRPSTPGGSGKLLPIMVWIHGGGFMIGSGADKVHDGTNLARDQQVIVISVNYRLGALGFLPQDSDGTGAMNGLFDQLNALQWIQSNAEAFGGDINQVTVFGESAGSESICMLSVSPLAKGLFHRAIMQSGDCIYNPWMYGVPSEDIGFALQAVDTLMNATGVASIQELRNSTLVDASTINYMSAASGWSIVVLDKEILPQHPRDLYRDASNIVPTDFMVGANSNEDVTFMGMSPEAYLQLAESGLNESVHTLVGSKYGVKVAEQVLKAYDANAHHDNDTVSSFSQFHGDWYIGCPSRAFASDVAAMVSGDVYLYNFAHFAVTDPVVHWGLATYVNTTSWASHMAEIPFVFGMLECWQPSFVNSTIPEQDQAMSQEIMKRWANFAKNGNPNLVDNEVTGSANDASAIWEPLPKETGSTTAISSLRGSEALGSSGGPPVLVFDQGRSRMSKLDAKTKQCAAFPFSDRATSDETGPEALSESGHQHESLEDGDGAAEDHDGISKPTLISSGSRTDTLSFWSLVCSSGVLGIHLSGILFA